VVHFLEKRVFNDIQEFSFADILVISNTLAVVDIFLAQRGIENVLINVVNKPNIDFLTKNHAVNLINSKFITFYDEFCFFLNYELHQINHFIKVFYYFLKFLHLNQFNILTLVEGDASACNK
jgi:hypothetical protein